MNKTFCPCGSQLVYDNCCGKYHRGEPAPTAEALMRSRYTAYALKNENYLLATYHPDTRPADLAPQNDEVKWIDLKIISKEKGMPTDTEGMVEFVARYKIGGRAFKMTEKSRFFRIENRWYYYASI